MCCENEFCKIRNRAAVKFSISDWLLLQQMLNLSNNLHHLGPDYGQSQTMVVWI